ncbi:ABC transporter substrate-binding protein [Amycolatopsis suaedae]|uniref:Amino acid ABC transporter substrate-binding protein n=1 Tax=Amycolatopsis suaedae TaxID=2510978 RepID=A0A4Q7JDL5_9PSEU|nr:ABC transporter substrate-binding protein [Amycolatopsis suaedae]RZQ65268.1 amino acid ABC transporter substrate-binding protein [Amycolatopsis suaedae]
MRKTIITVLAAALALAGCGGGDSDTLRVGTLGDAPPNIYVENGNYTGFDNELLKAIAAKQNLKVEFSATEFSSLLGQVANGQFDIGSSAIAQTDERKKNVDFSAPYNFEVMSIQTKEGSPVTDEASLAGKRIAVIQGTVGDRWLTTTVPAAQAVRFPDYAAALGALKSGSVEGYILDLTIAEKNVAANPDVKLKVTKSFTTDVPHGFAVRKGNGELLGKLNAGLEQVIADGTWARLHQQFLPSAPVDPRFQGKS